MVLEHWRYLSLHIKLSDFSFSFDLGFDGSSAATFTKIGDTIFIQYREELGTDFSDISSLT